MTDSMFGIKALFLCELYRDYEIDYYNGKISKVKKTYTFPRSISNLFVWVIESRKNFESAPDTGILGKGCTRIFHLFLNYILRLFCLGVLLIIFYPTFIIINIFTCLCLIILSPLLISLAQSSRIISLFLFFSSAKLSSFPRQYSSLAL